MNYIFLFKLLLLSWNFSGLITRNIIHTLPIQQSCEQRAFPCDCACSVVSYFSGFYYTGPSTNYWMKQHLRLDTMQTVKADFHSLILHRNRHSCQKRCFSCHSPCRNQYFGWLHTQLCKKADLAKNSGVFPPALLLYQAGSALWPSPPLSPH